MKFDLNESIEILSRTPAVLETLLSGLSDDWLNNNEGEESWSPYDIIGHLIHGEKTDWIPRMEIILSNSTDKNFKPFDRFAQKNESKGKSFNELLEEFKLLRTKNIEILRSKNLTANDLAKTGIHPEFGEVTLEQLLATMTVHDLGHIAQISRVMAKQYSEEAGPWKAYLPVLKK